MSYKIKCNEHKLVLLIPENDLENAELVSQVTKLFSHLSQFPNCKFEAVQFD